MIFKPFVVFLILIKVSVKIERNGRRSNFNLNFSHYLSVRFKNTPRGAIGQYSNDTLAAEVNRGLR